MTFTHRASYDAPFFRKLTDDQLAQLHSASLEILERTGALLYEQEAIDLLTKAGAHVEDGNRVRIPSHLVEWAIRTAPKRITLCDRDGNRVMPMEGYNVFYGPGSDCPNIIDLDTGEHRPATMQDCIDGIRVCDALDNIDFIMSFCMPGDVPPHALDRHQMRAILAHSTKPSMFVTTGFEGAVDAVEMAALVAGGMDALRQNPITSCYVNVSGPLKHNAEALQKLLYFSEVGLPFSYITVSQRGFNSPVTMAGSLALANAGDLVGVMLSQLKREGAPIMISAGTNDMEDMRHLVGAYAAPENRVHFMEMAHYYNLPIFGLGGASDSKIPDGQAAAEAAFTLLTETLAGAHMIHDVGYLASGMTASLEQMVIADELIAWVRRFVQGMEISEETLVLDLIDKLGPDGSFISEKHTKAHFREDFYPKLLSREQHDAWAAAGSTTLRKRANTRAHDILDARTTQRRTSIRRPGYVCSVNHRRS